MQPVSMIRKRWMPGLAMTLEDLRGASCATDLHMNAWGSQCHAQSSFNHSACGFEPNTRVLAENQRRSVWYANLFVSSRVAMSVGGQRGRDSRCQRSANPLQGFHYDGGRPYARQSCLLGHNSSVAGHCSARPNQSDHQPRRQRSLEEQCRSRVEQPEHYLFCVPMI